MNIQTNINSYEISVPRRGWNFALIMMREHTSPNIKIKYPLFWIPFRTLPYIQKSHRGKKHDTEQNKTAENKALTFKECRSNSQIY